MIRKLLSDNLNKVITEAEECETTKEKEELLLKGSFMGMFFNFHFGEWWATLLPGGKGAKHSTDPMEFYGGSSEP